MQSVPKPGLPLAVGVLLCLLTCGSARAAPDEVNPLLESALEIARSMPDPGDRLSALRHVAEAYAKIGASGRALSVLREAEPIAADSPEPARALQRIGRAALHSGLHDYTVEVSGRIPDHQLAAELLLEMADGHADASRQQAALDALDAAQVRLRQVRGVEDRVKLLLWAGRCYARLERIEAARALFGEAVDLVRQVEDTTLADTLLGSLIMAGSELNELESAGRLAEQISDPPQKMAAFLQLATVHAEAGDSDGAARLQQQATGLEREVAPSRQVRLLSDLATALTHRQRRELALGVLRHAERAAGRIADRDERATAFQQVALCYAALEEWEPAARLAATGNDPYGECKYRIGAVIGLEAGGDPDAALRALKGLDAAYLKYAGYRKLNELAQVYHRADPHASLEELAGLEPVEFRDRVMKVYALSAAKALDYERALGVSRHITSDARRLGTLFGAAESFLQIARSDQVPAAIEAAYRVVDQLSSYDDRTEMLFRIASKHLEVGNTQEATAALQRIEALLEPTDDPLDPGVMPETRAPANCKIGILLQQLGRETDALAHLREAVEEAHSIPCASCRTDVLADMVGDVLTTGHIGLLETTVEALDLPTFQLSECLDLMKERPDLSRDQKALLLHSALDGTCRQLLAPERVEALADVAVAYVQAGVEPSESDLQMLQTASAVHELPSVPMIELTAPGGVPGVAYLLFFTRSGCRSCAPAKELVQESIAHFPSVKVELTEYDLGGSEEAAALNLALSKRHGIPKRDHLVAPAVFSSFQGVVGDNINEDSVAWLIETAVGLPDPTKIPAPEREAGGILDKYEALKPLVVLSAGLLDGINPCAFTVIIFFLSYLTYIGKKRREILAAGIVFTVAVFVTYFAIGLGLAKLIGIGQRWSEHFTAILHGAIAVMVAAAAVLSFRDGLRCLKGQAADMTLSLPDSLRTRIRLTIAKRARLGLTIATTAVLGFVVALFEFPCTGQVYVPIVTMLQKPGRFWGPAGWLLVYNVFFILPLIVIFVAVLFGLTSEKLTAVFRRHMAKTKFAMAAVFAALCVLMVTYLT